VRVDSPVSSGTRIFFELSSENPWEALPEAQVPPRLASFARSSSLFLCVQCTERLSLCRSSSQAQLARGLSGVAKLSGPLQNLVVASFFASQTSLEARPGLAVVRTHNG
jgi:hypothetical protein